MKDANSKPERHIVIGVDANYLHKAVVFYKSLSLHHNNFILHLFCFDEVTFSVLNEFRYKNIILYHPTEFETNEILNLKKTKDRLYEYYWALNPYIARKVILEQNCDFVTLSDCDLMFFQSPEIIFREFDEADAIIQPNNFSQIYDNDFARYGYYCSSFQCFRNNENGKKILDYWYGKCLEWCSHTGEKGKFGDQMYLDDWRRRFEHVREVTNPGTNVAPWNVQKFDFSTKDGEVLINNVWPLVYYHYHSLKMNLIDYSTMITGDRNLAYPIAEDAVRLIYDPYIKILETTVEELKKHKVYKDYVSTNPQGNYHLQKLQNTKK